MKKYFSYFTIFEWCLWLGSMAVILLSFILLKQTSLFNLVDSLLGATSLIFLAKGNPFGQILMILFSGIYGVISYQSAYYGEVLTYVGMTAPMSLLALVSWLKHPYKGKRSQVAVKTTNPKEWWLAIPLTLLVTILFYFLLKALHTANLPVSTLSVTTSFLAVYLTFRRSPYYALAYAANDLVLIGLWLTATLQNPNYCSVLICFVVFLVNDLYGFICWHKMEKQQNTNQKGDN